MLQNLICIIRISSTKKPQKIGKITTKSLITMADEKQFQHIQSNYQHDQNHLSDFIVHDRIIVATIVWKKINP